MHKILLSSAAALTMNTLPVAAVELTYDGAIGLFQPSTASGRTYYHGTVDVGVGIAGGFGIELGADAFGMVDGDEYNATYYALSYTGSFGEIQIGMPRGAVDVVSPGPSPLQTATTAEISLFRGSSLRLIRANPDNYDGIGALYQNTFGGANVALSYHVMDMTPFDMEIIALGANFATDFGTVYGGFERADNGGSDRNMLTVGIEGQRGKLSYRAEYDSFTFSMGPAFQQMEVAVGYEVMDNLTVSGGYYSEFGPSPDELWYVGGEYSIASGPYIAVQYFENNSGTDTTVVEIGMRF